MSCGAGTAVGQRPAPFLVPPTLSTTLSAVNSAGGQHRAGQTRRACSPRRRARAPSPFCSAGAFPRRPRRRAPSPRCMPPPSPRRGLCDVIGTRLMSFPPDGPTDPQVPWLWHGQRAFDRRSRPRPRTQSFLRVPVPDRLILWTFYPYWCWGPAWPSSTLSLTVPPPLPVCLALVVNSGWRLAQILSGEAWDCPSAGIPKPPHPQPDTRC